ncbi:MAG: hypothetical protein D6807_06675, partial [Alphaproteobacteria bacterium]
MSSGACCRFGRGRQDEGNGPMSRFLFALLLLIAGATAADASEWQVVPDASRILWTAKWNTAPVQGGFEHFTASIDFDPRNLAQSHVRVVVDTGSIYMEGQDARATLTNDNWFDAARYPQAVFETRSFRDLGNGHYEAVADLTIRGVSAEVTLPFKLTIEDDIAR